MKISKILFPQKKNLKSGKKKTITFVIKKNKYIYHIYRLTAISVIIQNATHIFFI